MARPPQTGSRAIGRHDGRPHYRRNKTTTSRGGISARASYERYLALARDAASAGNTIEAENFYQHADHYFRVMRADQGE
ncbi:MAG: DUF4167 domain-containing protein [Pseudomonadota bacterium]